MTSSSWAASSSRVGPRRSFERHIRRPLNTVLMRVGAGARRRPVYGRYWRRFDYALNLDDPRRNPVWQTDDGPHFVDQDSGGNDTALSRRLLELHLEPAFSAGARNVADPVPHTPHCLRVRAREASRLRCFPYWPQLKRHQPLCLPARRVRSATRRRNWWPVGRVIRVGGVLWGLRPSGLRSTSPLTLQRATEVRKCRSTSWRSSSPRAA